MPGFGDLLAATDKIGHSFGVQVIDMTYLRGTAVQRRVTAARAHLAVLQKMVVAA